MAYVTDRGSHAAAEDWFRRTFDDLYPLLYAHRDRREAMELLAHIAALAPLGEGRVLDLGCGTGRYLQALLARGIAPVGLDLSPHLLKEARRLLPGVGLVRGDMRCLPLRTASIGWVLMMFTTFGYFRDEGEDARVLGEIARALAPGGYLVLDYVNDRYLRDHLVPRSDRVVRGLRVVERRWIDPDGPFLRKESAVGPMDDGTTRVYQERLRLYAADRVEAMLREAGLRIEARMGDYHGRIYREASSPRLVLLARRIEDAP